MKCVVTYSFLRADLRFSSFSSWAASRSLTSDPGAVAGIMSNWRSLLCRGQWHKVDKLKDLRRKIGNVFYFGHVFYIPAETHDHLLPCLSPRRCPRLSPDCSGTCPCAGRSLGSVCPQPSPISWSLLRDCGLSRRNRQPAGWAASHAPLFAEEQQKVKDTYTVQSNVCVRVCVANLGCDVEVLVLLQQLLCVMDAWASGGVCGEVKLPSVMNPLQSLNKHKHTRQIYRQTTWQQRAVDMQERLAERCSLMFFRVPVWHCVQTPHIADTGPAAVSSWSRSEEHDSLAVIAHWGCLYTTEIQKTRKFRHSVSDLTKAVNIKNPNLLKSFSAFRLLNVQMIRNGQMLL